MSSYSANSLLILCRHQQVIAGIIFEKGRNQVMDEWLHIVKDVLIQEGFRGTILQVIKPAQVFGLVKKLNDIWEMHVRGFDDGTLESEIEISRDYLEHFNDKYRRDATLELTRLLDTYQIPYEIKGEPTRLTAVLFPPKEVTPWKPLVAIAGIATFIAFLCWRGKGKDWKI